MVIVIIQDVGAPNVWADDENNVRENDENNKILGQTKERYRKKMKIADAKALLFSLNTGSLIRVLWA